MYICVAPAILFLLGEIPAFPALWATLSLAGFAFGLLLSHRPGSPTDGFIGPPLRLRRHTDAIVTLGCLGYATLSYQNDLIFRRVGFSTAAEAAATRPLYILAAIRVFEVLFYPFLITRYYAWRTNGRRVPWYLAIGLLIAFLTMGVLDSRARIVLPVLVFLVFVVIPGQGIAVRPRLMFISSVVVVGTLGAILVKRASAFSSVTNMITSDVLKRLNGYELLGQLAQANVLTGWGAWDFNMFYPLLAGIPWLRSTAELKATGMTSVKTYLLNDVLHLGQFDALSPAVVDPIYFGGALMLVAVMVGLAVVATRFDYSAKRGTWLRSPFVASVFMAIGLAGLRFEEGLTSAVFTIVRDSVIVWVMLRMIAHWPRSAQVETGCSP